MSEAGTQAAGGHAQPSGSPPVDQFVELADWRERVADLTLFWTLGYGGGLFLPFRDAAAGRETYGAGRYLTDTIKGTFGRGVVVDGDRVVLDFNYAYNPSCAYNPRWACPLAPPENWLEEPIRAGERAFPAAV